MYSNLALLVSLFRTHICAVFLAHFDINCSVICTHFGAYSGCMPLLQYQIFGIPLGTWMPNTGRGSVRQLAILQRNATLSSALDLLLEGTCFTWPPVCV